MIVQDFLRNGGTLADLDSKYAIKHRRHTRLDNLVLLKYSQMDSPMGEQITHECRGLILDEADNWNVVAWPFNKFFNYGEGHAADINWQTAKVQQKLDGSMITMYNYKGWWHVATTGTPDACGPVNDFGITFATLFWDTMRANQYDLPPEHYYGNLTFIFELMCPENRVVVRHSNKKLTLIGVRDRTTGQEFPVEQFKHLGWPVVNSYDLSSYDSIIDTFQNIDPLTQEGYVVVDSRFNRVKVKHPGYVAIHHMRDNICTKKLLEIVRVGEHSEFLTYYPEYKDKVIDIVARLDALKDEVTKKYAEISHLTVRKDFALEACKTRTPDYLFKVRDGRCTSINKYFAEMLPDHLMSVLNLKNERFLEE